MHASMLGKVLLPVCIWVMLAGLVHSYKVWMPETSWGNIAVHSDRGGRFHPCVGLLVSWISQFQAQMAYLAALFR